MQSNGVPVENGDIKVSKAKITVSNGTHIDNGEVVDKETSLVPVKKQARKLNRMETDIVRLMGQHLREMGYHKTLESLMSESGCPLEHPKASNFRAHVLNGDWETASKSLNDLGPLLENPTSIEKMRFFLLEEKYLEQLESGQELEALSTLRHELAPLSLHHTDKHIQTLTSYMMYPNKDLYNAASWPGVNGGSRQILVDKLQGFLPASVMLPPRRLQVLLKQAQELQVERCPFHYLDQNTGNYSLLTNHICSKCQFPCETVHIFTDHSDEVWFLKFSNDGKRLATGCKDGQIIIWNFVDAQPRREHVLKGQPEGIAYIAWSPNDQLLLSCGREGTPGIMVFLTETGEVKCHIQNSAEDSLTCGAWSSDGHSFYVGGNKGQFYQCSMNGLVTGSWEGVRVKALATHPIFDVIYAADTHSRIRQYNFAEKASSTLVQESHPIMSFVLSDNGRNALINIATQSVHVWDLKDRVLLRRYQGVSQSLYTIHSSYGGINNSFLASGSEDNNVYIWQTRRETPVAVLKGHSRPVNCVSWNPVNYELLASGSDDGTVRIWSTQERLKAQLECEQSRENEDLSRGKEKAYRVLDFCGAEGMDTQHSETTSEQERIGDSATSLSLSSEQLHENIVALAVENITQSSISQRTEPIRLRSGSHPERRPVRTDSGQWSTISEPGDSASATLSRLRSSSHGLDSSVDPDSSVLSLDSSNGSTSQGGISQSEFEEGIQFSTSEEARAPVLSESVEATRGTSQQEPESGSLSTVV